MSLIRQLPCKMLSLIILSLSPSRAHIYTLFSMGIGHWLHSMIAYLITRSSHCPEMHVRYGVERYSHINLPFFPNSLPFFFLLFLNIFFFLFVSLGFSFSSVYIDESQIELYRRFKHRQLISSPLFIDQLIKLIGHSSLLICFIYLDSVFFSLLFW